eukprot:767256-Hanusia_phi.AAC.6
MMMMIEIIMWKIFVLIFPPSHRMYEVLRAGSIPVVFLVEVSGGWRKCRGGRGGRSGGGEGEAGGGGDNCAKGHVSAPPEASCACRGIDRGDFSSHVAELSDTIFDEEGVLTSKFWQKYVRDVTVNSTRR